MIDFKVNVDRKVLIERLGEGRAEHMREHAKIVKRYHIELLERIEELRTKIKAALDGDGHVAPDPLTAVSWADLYDLQIADHHLSDYDTAIGMLTHSADATVTLNASDYKMLVNNQWEWRDSYTASNSRYR